MALKTPLIIFQCTRCKTYNKKSITACSDMFLNEFNRWTFDLVNMITTPFNYLACKKVRYNGTVWSWVLLQCERRNTTTVVHTADCHLYGVNIFAYLILYILWQKCAFWCKHWWTVRYFSLCHIQTPKRNFEQPMFFYSFHNSH